MAPKSKRKPVPHGLQSRSTPELPRLQSNENEQYTTPPSQSAKTPSTGEGEHNVQTPGTDESEMISDGDDALHLSAPRTLHTSRSYSHFPRQTTAALYPPFYNRPPTPLPASPSLTSLLRPPFASRRTTPDSSDAELSSTLRVPDGASTPASSTTNLVNSARHAPTVPRAAPKVPTYEYYGFAVYVGSSIAFLGYILWAYVPAPLLHQMGIYYYPDRWWALAIPCWLIMLIIYIYVALASYNTGSLTLALNSIENMVDETAQIAVVDPKTRKIVRDPVLVTDKLHEKDKEKGTKASAQSISAETFQFDTSDRVDWKELWSVGTDAVMDVPIGGVCEILYGEEP